MTKSNQVPEEEVPEAAPEAVAEPEEQSPAEEQPAPEDQAESQDQEAPEAEDGAEAEEGTEDGAEAAGERPRKSRSVSRLEEDGEIAADYLEELLDIADIDGDIDIDVEHGRAVVAVVSEDPLNRDLQRLVGADGEVLDAIQELTRLAVQARSGERSRLMLDIAGYRDGRRAELRRLAEEAIAEVKEKGVNLSLEPMNAFERKVVHDAVAEAGLVSESSGADPERYVVIRPA